MIISDLSYVRPKFNDIYSDDVDTFISAYKNKSLKEFMGDSPFYNAQALTNRQRRIDGHWRFKFEVAGQNEWICLYVNLKSSCEMFDLLET